VADEADSGEKTQAPTHKRRDEAAREGDVLQSKDLGAALNILGGVAWLAWAGNWCVRQCAAMIQRGLALRTTDIGAFDPQQAILAQGGSVALSLGVLLLLSLLAAIAGPLMLGSLKFRPAGFSFRISRLSPVAGLGRMFSMQGLIELGRSIVKAALIGAMGGYIVWHVFHTVFAHRGTGVAVRVETMGTTLILLVTWLAAAFALIAGADIPIQIVRRTQRLRMTRQQVKEELRQSEGAPESRQHIRQRQHAILNGSARKAIAEASVILTNPSHFAIALRYATGRDHAPVVVARGRDELALAIRQLGEDNGVPALEYPVLTRAIYFTTRAGQTISEDLYLAVATILAFVFNLDRALADGLRPPLVSVPAAMEFDAYGKRHQA
jgi:flagellar biosynthetic protein FlhB